MTKFYVRSVSKFNSDDTVYRVSIRIEDFCGISGEFTLEVDADNIGPWLLRVGQYTNEVTITFS